MESYTGPFLEGLDAKADERFEHWRDGVAARLLATYEHCVKQLCESANFDPPSAVEAWTRASLRLIPANVELVVLHFRAIAEQGRPAEAGIGIEQFVRTAGNELTRSERALLDELRTAITSASPAPRSSDTNLNRLASKLAFVGRTTELVKLRECWLNAAAGQLGALVLTGDPGIGKTKLLYQLARLAAIRGARVLSAAASPATARVPYATAIDLFGGVMAENLTSLTQAARRTAGVAARDRRQNTVRNVGTLDHAAYADLEFATASLLKSGPLLLHLNDLQWMDESSFHLVVYLAHRFRGQALLVAACARPEGEPLIDNLRAVTNTVSLRIGPLTPAASDELLAAMYAAQSFALDTVTRARLLARAAGNPFFLIAMAEDTLSEQLGVAAEKSRRDQLPGSISALITARLRQLSPDAMDVLRAMAVLRTHERIDIIGRVGGIAAAKTARAVSELLAFGLVSDSSTGVRSAHDLIAEVVYASTPDSVRHYLHQRAARALTGRGPAIVANHANNAQDFVKAFTASMQAARAASGIRAYAEAGYYYEMACSCARSGREVERASAGYLTFVCGLDRFASAAGRVGAARRHFKRVGDEGGLCRCDGVELDVAIRSGTRPLQVLTAEASRFVTRAEEFRDSRLAAEMLSVLYRAVELGSLEGPAARWINDAVRIAEQAEVDWRVALLGKAAVMSFFAVGPSQAEALADRLYGLAGEDARLQALAYGYMGVTFMLLGRLSEAERSYQEALKLAQDPVLADAYHKANMNLAVLETDVGRYESAKVRLTHATVDSVRTLVCSANLGFLALEMDDYEGAEAAATELRTRSLTLNAPVVVAASATLQGLVAWARKDYGQAISEAGIVESLIDTIPFQSDDSYAKMLIARREGLRSPQRALEILETPVQRAAVPQLRIDLEYARQLQRCDPLAARAAARRVVERADAMGAGPIAVRAAAMLDS